MNNKRWFLHSCCIITVLPSVEKSVTKLNANKNAKPLPTLKTACNMKTKESLLSFLILNINTKQISAICNEHLSPQGGTQTIPWFFSLNNDNNCMSLNRLIQSFPGFSRCRAYTEVVYHSGGTLGLYILPRAI